MNSTLEKMQQIQNQLKGEKDIDKHNDLLIDLLSEMENLFIDESKEKKRIEDSLKRIKKLQEINKNLKAI